MDQPIYTPTAPPEIVVHPRRQLPIATLALLAINVVVFVLMTLAGGSTNPDVLVEFGAALRPGLHRGEYWRLVMPMFLHIGLWHIAVNMYALWILGPMLEHVYGYGRYTLIYVAAGMGSAGLSMLRTDNVSAGASGAIMGIAGAMLLTGYLHRNVVPRRWLRVFGWGMVPMVVLTLAMGMVIPMIDNWGHLGGLITGSVLALLIPPPLHDADPYAPAERPSQTIVVVPVVIVAAAFVATAASYHSTHAVTRLLAEGERLHNAHQPDQARSRFEQAERIAPRDERPHVELGDLDMEQHRADEAMREYQQALALAPDSVEAEIGLAEAYEVKGDAAKADAYLRAVEQDASKRAEAQYELASLLYQHKLYRHAIEHYQQAIQQKPGLAEAQNDLAWLYATCDDPRYRDPAQALAHAQRAVELSHWKDPNIIDTLAEALYLNQRFQEALSTEARALALDPNNPDLKDHMARYRQAAGQ